MFEGSITRQAARSAYFQFALGQAKQYYPKESRKWRREVARQLVRLNWKRTMVEAAK